MLSVTPITVSPNVDLEMKSAREGFLPLLNKVVEVSQVSLPGNWSVVVVDFNFLFSNIVAYCSALELFVYWLSTEP